MYFFVNGFIIGISVIGNCGMFRDWENVYNYLNDFESIRVLVEDVCY